VLCFYLYGVGFQVLGFMSRVPGAGFQVPGSRFQVPSALFQVRCSKCRVPSATNLLYFEPLNAKHLTFDQANN